jgi:hypothetical protein
MISCPLPRESAVHGLGIFATRRLVLGDIIMVDDPVLVTPTGLTPESSDYTDRIFDSLTSQFQKLDSSKKVRRTFTVPVLSASEVQFY